MRYEIWYHLYNLKSVKSTHGGVLLLVKLQPAGNSWDSFPNTIASCHFGETKSVYTELTSIGKMDSMDLL